MLLFLVKRSFYPCMILSIIYSRTGYLTKLYEKRADLSLQMNNSDQCHAACSYHVWKLPLRKLPYHYFKDCAKFRCMVVYFIKLSRLYLRQYHKHQLSLIMPQPANQSLTNKVNITMCNHFILWSAISI